MKAICKKLSSSRGETLVETVAAILIFTFASIILLSMITTATKINYTAKQHDASMSVELNIAEAQDETYPDTQTKQSASIKVFAPGSEISQNIPVTEYNSGEGTLYSFEYRETT